MRSDAELVPEQTRRPPELAGLGRRFAARFIDGLLLLAIDASFIFPAVALDETRFDAVSGVLAILFILSLVFGGPIYETFLIGRFGQTVGKRLLRIKVVPAGEAVRVRYGNALGRVLLIFAAGFVPLLLLLVFGWALWDQQKQGLHDKVARTVVVRT